MKKSNVLNKKEDRSNMNYNLVIIPIMCIFCIAIGLFTAKYLPFFSYEKTERNNDANIAIESVYDSLIDESNVDLTNFDKSVADMISEYDISLIKDSTQYKYVSEDSFPDFEFDTDLITLDGKTINYDSVEEFADNYGITDNRETDFSFEIENDSLFGSFTYDKNKVLQEFIVYMAADSESLPTNFSFNGISTGCTIRDITDKIGAPTSFFVSKYEDDSKDTNISMIFDCENHGLCITGYLKSDGSFAFDSVNYKSYYIENDEFIEEMDSEVKDEHIFESDEKIENIEEDVD